MAILIMNHGDFWAPHFQTKTSLPLESIGPIVSRRGTRLGSLNSQNLPLQLRSWRCVNMPGGTRNKLHCTQLQTGVTGPNKLDAKKIGAHHSAWKTQSWELVPDHGRRCSHRLHWTLEFQALMVAGPASRDGLDTRIFPIGLPTWSSW